MGRVIGNTLAHIRRNWAPLLIDVLAFTSAYYASVQIRRSMNLYISHSDLFLPYGIAAVVIFFVLDVGRRSLEGLTLRGLAREAISVGRQMVTSWSTFTVLLFMQKEAHYFSRTIWATSFIVCTIAVYVARTLWKTVLAHRHSSGNTRPRLLVICDSSRTEEVIGRVMMGSYEGRYVISGVVTPEEPSHYNDYFALTVGLDNIVQLLDDYGITDAFVELENNKSEAKAIDALLAKGVTVHRGLWGSQLRYAGQQLDELAGYTVVAIDRPGTSLLGTIGKLRQRVYRRHRRNGEPTDRP